MMNTYSTQNAAGLGNASALVGGGIAGSGPTVSDLDRILRRMDIQVSDEEKQTYMQVLQDTYGRVQGLKAISVPNPMGTNLSAYPRSNIRAPTPADVSRGWAYRFQARRAAQDLAARAAATGGVGAGGAYGGAYGRQASPLLQGKTIVVKDNIAVAGVPMLGNFAGASAGQAGWGGAGGFTRSADMDALLVTRLLDSGATIVGKAVADPYNMSSGYPMVSQAYGHPASSLLATRGGAGSSPYSQQGGFGGFSLVGSGLADMAVCNDIPTSYTGLVSMRPTAGLVPMDGVLAYCPEIDACGPVASNIVDTALCLQAMTSPYAQQQQQAAYGQFGGVGQYGGAGAWGLGSGIQGSMAARAAAAQQGCDPISNVFLGAQAVHAVSAAEHSQAAQRAAAVGAAIDAHSRVNAYNQYATSPYASQRFLGAASNPMMNNLSGIRIGVLPDFVGDSAHPALRALTQNALTGFENLGATIVHIQLPSSYTQDLAGPFSLYSSPSIANRLMGQNVGGVGSAAHQHQSTTGGGITSWPSRLYQTFSPAASKLWNAVHPSAALTAVAGQYAQELDPTVQARAQMVFQQMANEICSGAFNQADVIFVPTLPQMNSLSAQQQAQMQAWCGQDGLQSILAATCDPISTFAATGHPILQMPMAAYTQNACSPSQWAQQLSGVGGLSGAGMGTPAAHVTHVSTNPTSIVGEINLNSIAAGPTNAMGAGVGASGATGLAAAQAQVQLASALAAASQHSQSPNAANMATISAIVQQAAAFEQARAAIQAQQVGAGAGGAYGQGSASAFGPFAYSGAGNVSNFHPLTAAIAGQVAQQQQQQLQAAACGAGGATSTFGVGGLGGFPGSAIPIGMHLVGAQYAEPTIFQVANAWEQACASPYCGPNTNASAQQSTVLGGAGLYGQQSAMMGAGGALGGAAAGRFSHL